MKTSAGEQVEEITGSPYRKLTKVRKVVLLFPASLYLCASSLWRCSICGCRWELFSLFEAVRWVPGLELLWLSGTTWGWWQLSRPDTQACTDKHKAFFSWVPGRIQYRMLCELTSCPDFYRVKAVYKSSISYLFSNNVLSSVSFASVSWKDAGFRDVIK